MSATAPVEGFRDREQAGDLLAVAIEARHLKNPVILALPRGGVPVAARVAARLGGSLDVLVVRKLGVPSHTEFGFGAIGEGGVKVIDRQIVAWERLSDAVIAEVEEREVAELARRVHQYRGERGPRDLHGMSAVVVDDGLATGATAMAAVAVARAWGAEAVIVAVPVASAEAAARLRRVADEVVSLLTPADFGAVGFWYDRFDQTDDAEVMSLLNQFGPAA